MAFPSIEWVRPANPFDFFMPEPTIILDTGALRRALARIAHEIAERNESSTEVVLVGVQRGGVHLARRLASLLEGMWGIRFPWAASTSPCTATTWIIKSLRRSIQQ